jgi:O-methyltransferase
MSIISKYLLKPLGLKISEIQKDEDFIQDADFIEIFKQCKPYTMTSIERMYALYNAVRYVVQNKIEGDFVECGVWRGGSSMMIALTLLKLGVTNRKIYLYDTFEGMSEPTENDVDFRGGDADSLLKKNVENKENSVWCLADLQDVQNNMALTKYSLASIKFVKGKVEDTIPKTISDNIALLRLDTDWYESTAHELKYLYPKLLMKGVLIIDDYGHWEGCRKAVDEYFEGNTLLLNRIDYTGRIAIKA